MKHTFHSHYWAHTVLFSLLTLSMVSCTSTSHNHMKTDHRYITTFDDYEHGKMVIDMQPNVKIPPDFHTDIYIPTGFKLTAVSTTESLYTLHGTIDDLSIKTIHTNMIKNGWKTLIPLELKEDKLVDGRTLIFFKSLKGHCPAIYLESEKDKFSPKNQLFISGCRLQPK